jgi:cell shape-determining protein MreC
MGGIDGWGIGGMPDFATLEKEKLQTRVQELEKENEELKRLLRSLKRKFKKLTGFTLSVDLARIKKNRDVV